MKTGLTIVKETDGIKFYGEIAESDIARLKLDNLDRSLMEGTDYNASPADQLLVMEMLFRRIQEQTK